MNGQRDIIAKRTAPSGAGDGVALPLFLQAELSRLLIERQRLARRIAEMSPRAGRKYELIGRLKALTAEAIRIENQLRGQR